MTKQGPRTFQISVSVKQESFPTFLCIFYLANDQLVKSNNFKHMILLIKCLQNGVNTELKTLCFSSAIRNAS
ncbi:hypothetical protein T4D_2543 [Trichinella pseudospiralis]|uniref:Uncharacterized protein n=1 Tax=Trichinella pseudospiralis TaxID=6337 RepID=A0A0V1FKR7_TRIPS|nr:hypothetical protein T4D_2543 [Trichinella pseudospiralis]